MLMFFSRYWWVFVVRGVIAVLFGVLAFTMPAATVAGLILVFGAYAFVDGVFALATAIAGRTITPDWWIVLLHGLVGIGIGMLTLLNPVITAVALLLYIAAWAIIVGLLQVYAAIRLRHELTNEFWLAVGGILGVAFGILMLWRPGAGALALLWVIASYAIVWGIMLIIGGFEVRRARKHVVAA
ncbi:MAG: HdeD family acid-resistance protein [Betaproteobacteria bacterium]